MNNRREPPVFPYQLIWEEFAPEEAVRWEDLEGKSEALQIIFVGAELGIIDVPIVNARVIDELVERYLGRPPSPSLNHRLLLIAAWQVVGQFRRQIGIDLAGQRPLLKSLHDASFHLWQVLGRISGLVEGILPRLASVEPERLLSEGEEFSIMDLRCATHDLALAAQRAYEDTKPRKTGRRPEMRRDTTIRFAANAIEEETGERIRTSRGNNATPTPHFTNAGGHLLRGFFKVLEPKIDEALIVQAFGRVRRQTKLHKNSRFQH